MKHGSIVYTDALGSYNAHDASGFHHERSNRSVEFANEKNSINGIENFRNQTKRHLGLIDIQQSQSKEAAK